MPERITEIIEHVWQPLLFALIGALLAIGKHLRDQDPWVWPVVIGRAICTGGISMSAGAVLIVDSGIPMIGQIGLAAALATVGTAGVERLLVRIVQGRG